MLLLASEFVIICYIAKIKLIWPRTWLKWAVVASTCFTFNSFILVGTIAQVGLFSMLYLAFGSLFLGVLISIYLKCILDRVIEDDEDE